MGYHPEGDEAFAFLAVEPLGERKTSCKEIIAVHVLLECLKKAKAFGTVS